MGKLFLGYIASLICMVNSGINAINPLALLVKTVIGPSSLPPRLDGFLKPVRVEVQVAKKLGRRAG